MELRTLRYFVAIAEAGTVSAAADTVRVTQPSLSRQVRALEHDLGVDLFERSHGRLALSATGRALLPRARDLVARANALRAAAGMHAHGRLEHVMIAAPTTTLTDVVSPFLATLKPDDPVPMVFESDGLTVDEARERGADLVISTARPRAPLASHPLPPLPVWAYVHRRHRWAERGTVPLAELVEQELIGLPVGHSAQRAMDAAVLSAGVNEPSMIEASNGTVAQALAAAGRGIAVVSDDPRFDLARMAVLITPHEPLSVRLHCAWDGQHPAASTLGGIARRIGEFVVRQYSGDATERVAPGRDSVGT